MQRPTLTQHFAEGPRPLTATESEVDDLQWWGHGPHRHNAPQLLYAAGGSCAVEVAGLEYRADQGTAVWIAANALHSARFDDEFIPVSVLPAPDRPGHAPACTLAVDAQLRTLLLRYARVDEFIALGQLLERIQNAPAVTAQNLPVTIPRGRLTGPIAAAFEADPSHDNTLDEWAVVLHCSVTSLRRAFLTETGLSFTEWRTRFRVERAIPLLERGAQVGLVAARVGMTHNGFTNAFRRTLGHTPVAHRAA
ncbi:hypothetical protein ACIFOC_00246 [Leucobacter aridicollis]|uniref:helix-turn-helix domain-containing protein n=1 Tax=Leucobacter aridicollis TaxID=283878 RepID=UPI000F14C468|nr:AraC family transcriptional regulator [Leucobacter aridicollis]MCS3426585.1 AraC-like DNA-binding protein [Leucobacter aridicollis]RKQ89264.1 AraC-like DNA-binding protein [Mycolicibacterium mucogenicum 261Sha1.1M5]